ncbi:MAG: hypothetical protein AAFX93_07360 [Verrucomicrobiota bacterium]
MREEPVKIGEWILALILMSIPFLNIFMLIYWACSSSTKPSKQNFAIAYLIFSIPFFLMALGFVIFALVMPAYMHHEEAQKQSQQQAQQAQQSEPWAQQPAETEQSIEMPATDDEHFRTFVLQDGGLIHGKVVSLDGDMVKLKRIDGVVFDETLVSFSDKDIEYILELHYTANE